ncbi:MAG: NADP-dependent malic enzyme [Bacteroidetes bacterium]|nr:NADP-dependent malic enzyme [Bacteroidota bacterium]
MKQKIQNQDALDYHSKGRPGKIEVVATKPTSTQMDLALAYSPGVAVPCLEIAKDKELVRKYTAKANLVGVISNGTAVLGLGNIGPEASKPVMEGKGILFKVFADIDVFDIEVNATEVEDFVKVVKALEPTFGGINLEDIAAPECFEIERRLKAEMNIPVMHDDQHGTAMIVGAAMLNAAEIVGKKMKDIKFVVSGAGASAISCMKILVALGASTKNFLVFDSKGLITKDRKDLDDIKRPFATSEKYETLEKAMNNADAFIGLSKANIISQDMVKSMAKDPIVFALANPDPEIDYELAKASRPDVIVATGRSDHPNQVNNVLGFPYIFRGALDVNATTINEEMKLAVVKALAELTRTPVPDIVAHTYNMPNMTFGREYIIPKPIDPRLIYTIAPAVAKAAMKSGVAKIQITDWDAYEEELRGRIGIENKLTRIIVNRAKKDPKRVVFAEADNLKILKAAQIVRDEKIAHPILLGNVQKIKALIKEYKLGLENVPMIDPIMDELHQKEYGQLLFDKRKRRGLNKAECEKLMRLRNYYGSAMVQTGEADALISGLTRRYPETIRPALHTIGAQDGVNLVAGMYILITKKGPFFLADTTVNIAPTAEDLVTITELTYNAVKQFDITPKIAMLSFSNFGSTDAEQPKIVAKAVSILKKKHPEMIIDGELQANFAVNPEMMKEHFEFSDLTGHTVNTLIFPSLSSGNIAYKLLQELGAMEAIGPVLLGMKKSVHILQLGSSVREIVNMVSLAVMDAQNKEKK